MAAERDPELRASSDRMLAIMERCRTIEERKRVTEVGSAEFIALADEAEELARLVFRWSQVEAQIAHSTPVALARGELSGKTIEEIVARPLDRVLAEWREAEFRFRAALPGSEDAEMAATDMERLREEYRATQVLAAKAVERLSRR